MTQRDFTCFEEIQAYAFCLKDGFKHNCKEFSADIEHEKLDEGTLKISKPERTTSITFSFKDGENEITKKIDINYYCFKEIRPKKIDVDLKDNDILEIKAYLKNGNLPPEREKYTVSAIYSKSITIQSLEEEKITIIYQRKFNYPYKDIITLKFDQKLAYLYVSIPYLLEIKSETEPFTRIKAETKFENVSTTSDNQGKFKLKIKVFPEDEFINLELKDKAGNITKEKIYLEFPKTNTDFLDVIQTENGIIVFSNQQIKGLKRQSTHIYSFFPVDPGEHSIKIAGKEFKILKRNFPALLNVEYDRERKEIYADGTSEITFLIKITDIYHKEINQNVNIEHNYDDRAIEIKSSNEKIIVLVKKMLKDKLKISFSYEFLKYEAEFTLLPGPPVKIVAKTERDHIYGDGKDKLNIQAFLQDRAENIITQEFMSSEIYASADYGKIHIENQESGIHRFTYTAKSMTNTKTSIKFRYENLSESLNISILAKKSLFQISPNFGLLSNIKSIIPTAQIQLSYARLLGGRYVFLDTSPGYFQTKIQGVDFKSIYDIITISLNIFTGLRMGAGGAFLIYLISFQDISETLLTFIPGIRISYTILEKISLNTSFFIPRNELQKNFIITENTFERLMITIGYIIDL